jgi:hypothetical protein
VVDVGRPEVIEARETNPRPSFLFLNAWGWAFRGVQAPRLTCRIKWRFCIQEFGEIPRLLGSGGGKVKRVC